MFHGIANGPKDLNWKGDALSMFCDNIYALGLLFFAPATAKAEEYMRGMVTGGTLFEELGFFYVGPVDGHNLEHLLPVLKHNL